MQYHGSNWHESRHKAASSRSNILKIIRRVQWDKPDPYVELALLVPIPTAAIRRDPESSLLEVRFQL